MEGGGFDERAEGLAIAMAGAVADVGELPEQGHGLPRSCPADACETTGNERAREMELTGRAATETPLRASVALLHRSSTTIQRMPFRRRLKAVQGGAQITPDHKRITSLLARQPDAMRSGALPGVGFMVAMGKGGKHLDVLMLDAGAIQQGPQAPVSANDRAGLREHDPEMQTMGRGNDHGKAAVSLDSPKQGEQARAVPCPDRGTGAVVVQIDDAKPCSIPMP